MKLKDRFEWTDPCKTIAKFIVHCIYQGNTVYYSIYYIFYFNNLFIKAKRFKLIYVRIQQPFVRRFAKFCMTSLINYITLDDMKSH